MEPGTCPLECLIISMNQHLATIWCQVCTIWLFPGNAASHCSSPPSPEADSVFAIKDTSVNTVLLHLSEKSNSFVLLLILLCTENLLLILQAFAWLLEAVNFTISSMRMIKSCPLSKLQCLFLIWKNRRFAEMCCRWRLSPASRNQVQLTDISCVIKSDVKCLLSLNFSKIIPLNIMYCFHLADGVAEAAIARVCLWHFRQPGYCVKLA